MLKCYANDLLYVLSQNIFSLSPFCAACPFKPAEKKRAGMSSRRRISSTTIYSFRTAHVRTMLSCNGGWKFAMLRKVSLLCTASQGESKICLFVRSKGCHLFFCGFIVHCYRHCAMQDVCHAFLLAGMMMSGTSMCLVRGDIFALFLCVAVTLHGDLGSINMCSLKTGPDVTRAACSRLHFSCFDVWICFLPCMAAEQSSPPTVIPMSYHCLHS